MLRQTSLVLALALLAACTSRGEVRNPFVKAPPFVPTPVPADFAVVVDENHDTFVARQHIQQVITAADSMSRTSYARYSDYTNTIAEKFSQESPLSASQLQAMWNEVCRYNLMEGSTIWINWRSDADIYKRNAYTIQIRANGRTRTYRATNGFSGTVRPLMLQVGNVRLPISTDANVPVVEHPTMEPVTQPTTTPATIPETQPATLPAAASELNGALLPQ